MLVFLGLNAWFLSYILMVSPHNRCSLVANQYCKWLTAFSFESKVQSKWPSGAMSEIKLSWRNFAHPTGVWTSNPWIDSLPMLYPLSRLCWPNLSLSNRVLSVFNHSCPFLVMAMSVVSIYEDINGPSLQWIKNNL